MHFLPKGVGSTVTYVGMRAIQLFEQNVFIISYDTM
jgi:hypothetical protein